MLPTYANLIAPTSENNRQMKLIEGLDINNLDNAIDSLLQETEHEKATRRNRWNPFSMLIKRSFQQKLLNEQLKTDKLLAKSKEFIAKNSPTWDDFVTKAQAAIKAYSDLTNYSKEAKERAMESDQDFWNEKFNMAQAKYNLWEIYLKKQKQEEKDALESEQAIKKARDIWSKALLTKEYIFRKFPNFTTNTYPEEFLKEELKNVSLFYFQAFNAYHNGYAKAPSWLKELWDQHLVRLENESAAWTAITALHLAREMEINVTPEIQKLLSSNQEDPVFASLFDTDKLKTLQTEATKIEDLLKQSEEFLKKTKQPYPEWINDFYDAYYEEVANKKNIWMARVTEVSALITKNTALNEPKKKLPWRFSLF